MKKFLLMCCLLMGLAAISQARIAGRPDSDPREKAKGLQKNSRLERQANCPCSRYLPGLGKEI